MDANKIIANTESFLSSMNINSSDIRMEEFEQKKHKYYITVSFLTNEPHVRLGKSDSESRIVRVYKDLVVNPKDSSVKSVKIHRN